MDEQLVLVLLERSLDGAAWEGYEQKGRTRKREPDELAAEARRWLGWAWHEKGRHWDPRLRTPAMSAVRQALKPYYDDLDAVFPLEKRGSLLAQAEAGA